MSKKAELWDRDLLPELGEIALVVCYAPEMGRKKYILSAVPSCHLVASLPL